MISYFSLFSGQLAGYADDVWFPQPMKCCLVDLRNNEIKIQYMPTTRMIADILLNHFMGLYLRHSPQLSLDVA